MSAGNEQTTPSILVLHSSCREERTEEDNAASDAAAAVELPQQANDDWQELVATATFSCHMLLVSDTASGVGGASKKNDDHRIKFPNERLQQPCGSMNVFSLSNLVADSYTLSLTSCRLQPTVTYSSGDPSWLNDLQLFAAEAVPSTWHFSWNGHAHADIAVAFDLTQAKSQFVQAWQAQNVVVEHFASNATSAASFELQEPEEPSTFSLADEVQYVSLPTAVDEHALYSHHHNEEALPALPTQDSRFLRLETLMESELQDINRILVVLAGTGLVLFSIFLWTAFQVSRNSKASAASSVTKQELRRQQQQHRLWSSSSSRKNKEPPIESLSMRAVAAGAPAAVNMSPLSLDSVLAAAEASRVSYGPKQQQRSSRRAVQPRPVMTVENCAVASSNSSDLSPCSKFAQDWNQSKSARRSFRRELNGGGDANSNLAKKKFVLTPLGATSAAAVETTATSTAGTTDQYYATATAADKHPALVSPEPVEQRKTKTRIARANSMDSLDGRSPFVVATTTAADDPEPPASPPGFVQEYWGSRI